MVKRSEITEFLDTYLAINDIEDACWNGIQFEGKEEAEKIGFAVDAGSETFKKAAEKDIDFLIVHHGNFWRTANPSMKGWNKERTDLLYKNNLSLYAAHLPLDRHRIVGNNSQILKLFDANITGEFIMHQGKNIGWIGVCMAPLNIHTIEGILIEKLGDIEITSLPFGPETVKTIAVCTGGGDYANFFEALDKNVDLYITGDTSDIYHTAKDAGINVIFAGHNATETVGLKALQKVIEEKFLLPTVFIDLPTGL